MTTDDYGDYDVTRVLQHGLVHLPGPLAFLDVDGVLNTETTWGNRPLDRAVDTDKVERLERWCALHDVSLVLSSTWRHAVGYAQCRSIFGRKGLSAHRLIGFTPLMDGFRGWEIAKWLQAVPQLTSCARMVVFEDGPLEDDIHAIRWDPYVVRTTIYQGLTDERLEYADHLLRLQSLHNLTRV